MSTRNFTQFDTASPLTTGDYLVGYNAAGTAEIKTQVKQIYDLIPEAQTLFFTESSADLTLTKGGNTVTLSAIDLRSQSGAYTIVNTLSNNWESTYSTVNAFSGNWEDTYTTVKQFSSDWSAGSVNFLPTVTNYLSTNNVLVDGLTITDNVSSNNLRVSFNNGQATGNYSHAINKGSATGQYSHAEGLDTIAQGSNSHAEGNVTLASGFHSHAEGSGTIASGEASHAEGGGSQAQGETSHAEGSVTIAQGEASHAEGINSIATGHASHAAGYHTTALQDHTYIWSDGNLGVLTENISTTRAGQYMVSASGGMFIPGSVGIGSDNNLNALTVVGNISGYENVNVSFNKGRAIGYNSFATGTSIASGDYSFAEGFSTMANGNRSHAEGSFTDAIGTFSHAEGASTTASGDASHAEGVNTIAFGEYSHAEGENTIAFGTTSRATGHWATAAHNYTSIWSDGNLGTLTENISTTRSGQYMVSASGGMFIPGKVGIGTDSLDNALTVSGNISASQSLSAQSLTLTNATVTQGQTLTSSLSSLTININGQNYRVPLLAV